LNDANGMVFVVSAASGTGKSSVLARVISALPGLRFSVSHTTRSPRSSEKNGVHYFFIQRDEFETMIESDRFLEWAEVHGQLYGTSRAEVERARADGVDLILDVDVQGAAQVRSRLPEATTVFLVPPTRAALEERLRGRGRQAENDVRRRLSAARTEIARCREYDYLVVNDRLDECVAKVQSIIRASRCRRSRMIAEVERVLRTFSETEKGAR
jgi:guanylate kinase